MRRKLGFCMGMVHRPSLLVLDQPSTGVLAARGIAAQLEAVPATIEERMLVLGRAATTAP